MQGEAARGRRVGAATKAAHARLPMCKAGRLSHSRWRGRAPPAAGELLGEETRQIDVCS